MHAQTKRQREVLDLIARYIDSHGYRPSYQLIARHLGLRSRAGIARIVHDLESQGLLTRHREEGHFSIKVESGESGVQIEWLDYPQHDDTREACQESPLTLPKFVLGGYQPMSLRAFLVRDDAMSGGNICEGDIAIIELREFTRYGQAVIAVLNGRETVLRKYYRMGAEIELRTADSDGKIISIPANRVKIIGVYRGLIRPAV